MKAKVQVVIESEHGQLIVHDVATITRTTFSTGTLGLSLSEGKNLLQHLQASIVNQQVSEWLRDTRDCPICGSPRSLKGHHSLVCQTVFGKVQLDSPRLRHCPCEKADHRSFSPLSKRLSERTTPELAYLEAKWASLMSYGLTVDILSEVLPLEGQINTTSIRRQVERVADRVEQAMGPEKGIYLEGMERDWGKLPRPEEPITVGIDGGFVRGRDGKSRGEGHFEVIAGKSIAENDSKCFAYVTRYDEKPKRRLYEVLKSQGMQMNQQVTFLSDGAENVRTLQYDLNPHAEYILDWFHLTMRLTVMRQMAKGLPGEEDPKATEKALDHLKRIKWYLWHGNVYRALQAVEDLTWHLDCLEPGEAQAKLFKTVEDFERYIHSNQTNITNYGYRYRNGERISTGFVESTINQVVSKRFVKKQQMRWTERGAHLLLQVRTKVLNDQLRDTFEGWYPEMKEAA